MPMIPEPTTTASACSLNRHLLVRGGRRESLRVVPIGEVVGGAAASVEWMFAAGRRMAVVGAVVAVLCGFLLQRGDTGPSDVLTSGPHPASTVLAESAPVGVMPAAVRSRALVDAEALVVSGWSKPLRSEHGLAATSLSLAAAVMCWRLTRPHRRVAAPLQRFCMAPLRAPPACV